MRVLRFFPTAFLAGVLMAIAAASAQAATVAAFTEPVFKAAQADGRSILVDISATWCPTCMQQKAIIDRLADTRAFSALVILHVDFDTQKDVVRALGARAQSTLIVFHGTILKGISVGDTSADSIKALLDKSRS